MKARLRPKSSATGPASSSRPPNASAYAATIIAAIRGDPKLEYEWAATADEIKEDVLEPGSETVFSVSTTTPISLDASTLLARSSAPAPA
jgi:hypothetical protein